MKFEIKEIDPVTHAFPARVEDELLPPWEKIPEEYRRGWHQGDNKWCAAANTWFCQGLEGYEFIPKDGVDADKAFRHLGACMRSFQPKHEHKIAGVAYLMSLWFEDVKAPA